MTLQNRARSNIVRSALPPFGSDLVVRTRFIPPRARASLLPRPHLHTLLERFVDYPLILIKAEAGHGKTTSIASFLSQSRHPYFWYSLGDTDTDPLIFLLHLIYVFRGKYPEVGERSLGLLAQEGGASRLWSHTIDALTNDLLDVLTEETILVLDDYWAQNHAEISVIMERLIEHMPPRLHLIITARTTPNLPGRVRWRAGGEMLEISRADLVLTLDEIQQVITQRTGRPATPELVQALAAETEGWPIAVQMLVEGLAQGEERDFYSFLGRMPGQSDLLFDYLAGEVFLRQPPEAQRFLAETAILRSLDPAACDAILESTGSAEMLRWLEERSLFVVREGTYRYHRLFQDFLLRRGDLPAAKREELHTRAAAYYQEQWENEEAVYHLLTGQKYEAAADLLCRIARSMVRSGRHHTLGAWLAQLPPALLDQYPPLLVAEGDTHRYASRYREALNIYSRAQEHFKARDEGLGEALALRGQAEVYLDTVQPNRAEPLLREALRKVGRDAKYERASLLILLAENRVNLGQIPQGERLHRAVYHATSHERDDIPLMNPRVYLRDGRFAHARQLVESSLRQELWSGDPGRMPCSHREANVLLAWLDAMTGNAESARRYAGQSLELAQTLDSPMLQCISLSRLGHSWMSGADFDPVKAEAYYRDAVVIAERIGVPRLKSEALLGLILVAGFHGKMPEAEATANEGLAIIKEAGDRYMEAYLLLALGAAAVSCHHPNAAQWLRDAACIAQDCGDRFIPCATSLWLALALTQAGHTHEAHTALLETLTTAQTHNYDFLFTQIPFMGVRDHNLRKSLTGLLQALVRTDEKQRYLEYTRRLLSHLAPAAFPVEIVPTLEEISTDRPLYIQTLGSFRVWCYGHEIEHSAWGREKAMHLLQFLICQRGQPAQREQILDALWPESYPEAAATGLRVALSTLRKVFQNARSVSEASHPPIEFILRESSSLTLDYNAGVTIDADQFNTLIQQARRHESSDPEAAVRYFEQGLSLYRGHFLEDNLYAEWTVEERERLLDSFLSSAERLARLYLQQGAYERSADWANTILAKDPLWENAYAVLMECHWKQGNRAFAVRLYERCRKRLAESLGVEPAEETTTLFERICRVDT